jgi:enoyl-CoA hydratase
MFSRSFQTLFQKVANLEKPTIAAISALGGDFEVALPCDIRIISDNASIGLPEIDIGALPAGGGTQILPRLVGLPEQKNYFFCGRRINAEKAFNIVTTGELMPISKKLDCDLSIKSSKALTAIKKLVNMGLSSALSLEAETFGLLSTNEDFRERVLAFIEKRKPEFMMYS